MIAITSKGRAYCTAQPAPDMAALMADIREANRVHLNAIDAVDAYIHTGDAPQELWDAQDAACRMECDAALAIISYRPRSPEEMVEKIAFLRMWWVHTQPEREELDALLASIDPEERP